MKFENINENTIKISLTFEDLSDHDVKLLIFFQNQQVIEQLFYELVEELGLENRFNQTGLLTFQVQPHPKGVHLIVSEELLGENGDGEIPDDPEEFEEMMNGFYNKLNEIGSNMAAERGIKDHNPGLGSKETKEPQKEADYIFLHDKIRWTIEFAQRCEKCCFYRRTLGVVPIERCILPGRVR
ncbi:adaptor protein MecA [Lactococcus fujiensis]|uniref:adaptor protein MecA n=1 Tax=Lactococcus fujiensis TaxID=610251 RepID=UPI000AC47E71|nr:adaptor protein MecA [Lactococcus fujiensis]